MTDQYLGRLLDYIEAYAEYIHVRENIDGKWGSYNLTQLTSKQTMSHVFRWIKDGHYPHRIKTPDEMVAVKDQ